MDRILCALLLSVLFFGGCRQAPQRPNEAIVLSVADQEVSKTDVLVAGDEVAVFARISGTEHYFLEGEKFITGSDGQSLSASPIVHYPEAKQAVNFYAYFPYHTGVFSVPSNQSTPAALKQADLCWATAQSTPVAVVPLEFRHLFARLVVTTNEPTAKIACQVVSSGVLNAATAEFTLGSDRKEVSTTGNELILPVQPLSRLVLTLSGVEYVYEGSITLEAGKTTSLNLTLNTSTHTATLNGSSVTAWTTSNHSATTTQSATNTLTIHWPKCHPKSGSVDKIALKIKDHTTNTTTDYTVSSGITYANQMFTVPFASSVVFYPYTIEHITLYQSNTWVHESSNLLGALITKRGALVVGVRQLLNPPAPTDYVEINGLKWAKGNLIAVNNRECKIGAPGDGGLYFQFGSLIGYKGGALANGGTGVGSNPYTGSGTQWWGGAGSFSWANDAMVWPSELVGTKTSWTNTTGSGISTLSDYYFNYSVAPWETSEKNIRDFAVSISGDSGSGTLGSGRYAAKGVGDPCTYYLGGTWRLPTTAEYVVLCNNQGGSGWVPWATAGGSWTTSPTYGGNFYSNKLFFPASGYRTNSNGSFNVVTTNGYYWSSSVYSATDGYYLYFYQHSGVIPQYNLNRSNGFPVRCVASVP